MGAIKLLDDDTLAILAVPLGGPFSGKDGDGEYFTAKTDLCEGWRGDTMPLLYHHGLDDGPGVEPIGRVDCKSFDLKDDGWWVKAQLDKRSKYLAKIKKLIEAEALGASSGAMSHLVRRTKAGEITRWPMVELSLTPTPCNPCATVTVADAAKHYKSLDIELPPLPEGEEPEGGAPAAKADGAIPADGGMGTESRGSYEALIAGINRALHERFRTGGVAGLPPSGYAYTLATFGPVGDGYCVVRCGGYEQGCIDDDTPVYFRVDLSVAEGGAVTLGAATALERVYVPAGGGEGASKSLDLDAIPLALAADTAIRTATAVGAQAEAVSQRRRDEGRELSEGNRARVKALADELQSSADALRALIAPPEAGAEAPDGRVSGSEHRLKMLSLAMLGA